VSFLGRYTYFQSLVVSACYVADGDPPCAALRLLHVNAQGGYEVDPAFYTLGGGDRIPQGKASGASA